jgi:predicted nucleic acid-binding protein
VWLALGSLPFVEFGRDAWTQAGELAHELRSRGAAVPLIDLLLAVAAVRADASLWTRDSEFERVADVLPELQLYR